MIKYAIHDKDGRIKVVDDPGDAPVISQYAEETRDDLAARVAVNRFEVERWRYQKWLTKLSPAYSGLLDNVAYTPEDARAGTLWTIFDAVVKSDLRDNAEKWAAMGSPKYLEWYMGFAKHKPTERDLVIYAHWDDVGYTPPAEGPHNGKRVRDTATGEVWHSAADLAQHLGCHIQTVYGHLNGRLKTCKGRVFEYAAEGVDGASTPGSVNSMTDDQREVLRAQMRAAGWTPRF